MGVPTRDEGSATCPVNCGSEPGAGHVMLVFCDLDKVVKEYNERGIKALDSKLKAWLYVIAKGYRNPEEVRAIMEYLQIPELGEFVERYNMSVSDPDLLRAYFSYALDVMEINSIRYNAHEKGLAEGRTEGLEQGREEGLAEGREQGLEQGLEQGTERERERIISLLQNSGASPDLIAQI